MRPSHPYGSGMGFRSGSSPRQRPRKTRTVTRARLRRRVTASNLLTNSYRFSRKLVRRARRASQAPSLTYCNKCAGHLVPSWRRATARRQPVAGRRSGVSSLCLCLIWRDEPSNEDGSAALAWADRRCRMPGARGCERRAGVAARHRCGGWARRGPVPLMRAASERERALLGLWHGRVARIRKPDHDR